MKGKGKKKGNKPTVGVPVQAQPLTQIPIQQSVNAVSTTKIPPAEAIKNEHVKSKDIQKQKGERRELVKYYDKNEKP